jgi:hypothetical protein
MIERGSDRFAVRAKFLAWLTFAIALAVLAHAAWDYAEARGLRARVDAIRAKGEPASIDQVRQSPGLTNSGIEAARLYRAATALASNWNRNAYVALDPPGNVMNVAPQNWSSTQREQANRLITANRDVLDLVDRATAIEFHGFPPGTDYSYRFAEVWQLEQLASLRTRILAVDRRDDAVKALHVQLLLLRSMDREYPNSAGLFIELIARDLALVVGRVRPTETAFAAFDAVLAALDRDNRVKRIFLAQRAEWLSNGSLHPRSRFHPVLIPWEAVRRPFDLHVVNGVADMQTHNLEYADLPWPQRLEPFRGVDLGPFTEVKDARAMVQYAAASTVRQEARNTALVRNARIAIAIERGRESHAAPEIPKLLDPYSGKPMRVKRDDVSYTVYSVGPNGRDDGGHATLDLTFRPVPQANP